MRRPILYTLTILPLAVAFCMGAGLLGYWHIETWWQWPLCVLGVVGGLVVAWGLIQEASA